VEDFFGFLQRPPGSTAIQMDPYLAGGKILSLADFSDDPFLLLGTKKFLGMSFPEHKIHPDADWRR
jgi:hypothetical protein